MEPSGCGGGSTVPLNKLKMSLRSGREIDFVSVGRVERIAGELLCWGFCGHYTFGGLGFIIILHIAYKHRLKWVSVLYF